MLWVQARAVVRGRPRNLVALLKREQFAEAFGASNAVTAGSFETTNSGNKTIIDATGSQVVVRCTTDGRVLHGLRRVQGPGPAADDRARRRDAAGR